MGLNRNDKTPCGFCFVEYYTHQDALDCMKYIGGTKLDERIIRTDLDPGFQEGRQYGYVFIPPVHNLQQCSQWSSSTGGESPVAKFVMNTERTLIWDEAVLALRCVVWKLNAKRRKMNMVGEGRRMKTSIGAAYRSGRLAKQEKC